MTDKKLKVRGKAKIGIVVDAVLEPRKKGEKTVSAGKKGTTRLNAEIFIKPVSLSELSSRLKKASALLETGKAEKLDKSKIEAEVREKLESDIKKQFQAEFDTKYIKLEEWNAKLQDQEETLAQKEADLIKKEKELSKPKKPAAPKKETPKKK